MCVAISKKKPCNYSATLNNLNINSYPTTTANSTEVVVACFNGIYTAHSQYNIYSPYVIQHSIRKKNAIKFTFFNLHGMNFNKVHVIIIYNKTD